MRAGRAWVLGVIAIAIAIACADAAPEPAVSGTAAADPQAQTQEGSQGDPLLAEARASIVGGRIDREVAARIRASEDPVHARAARLLAAFDGESTAVAGAGAAGDSDPAPVGPPPVVPPADLDPDVGDPPETDAAAGTLATSPTPQADAPGHAGAGTSPTPPPKKSRPELSALSLSATDAGATLTIKAPGGVTVGVANQPSSGIVRLVIEGASAAPKVVGARPKVGGARVTGVRKGEDTVQITLQLDPGWRLANVKSFSGGARVNLIAP